MVTARPAPPPTTTSRKTAPPGTKIIVISGPTPSTSKGIAGIKGIKTSDGKSAPPSKTELPKTKEIKPPSDCTLVDNSEAARTLHIHSTDD